MRYALVKDGIVANVVVWDGVSEWTPPADHALIDLAGVDPEPGPQWLYDGAAFSPPPPPPLPVPSTISDRQFFQQLAISGAITQQEAKDAVKTGSIPAAMQAVIDAMPEADRFAAEMLVSGAVEFRRDHPLVAVFAAAMGWTGEQVDDLFRAAALL